MYVFYTIEVTKPHNTYLLWKMRKQFKVYNFKPDDTCILYVKQDTELYYFLIEDCEVEVKSITKIGHKEEI